MTYRGLRKVISGGQTGADQAGLMAARVFGLETGGWCPAEWRTNLGPMPLLEAFGLVCMDTPSYAVRTALNIQDSDATVVMGYDLTSPGSRLTIRECEDLKRPCLITQFALGATGRDPVHPEVVESRQVELIYDFILEHKVEVLNVAGNRDTEGNLSNYRTVRRMLTRVFTLLRDDGALVT